MSSLFYKYICNVYTWNCDDRRISLIVILRDVINIPKHCLEIMDSMHDNLAVHTFKCVFSYNCPHVLIYEGIDH